MRITGLCPLIVTNDPESVVKLFEDIGSHDAVFAIGLPGDHLGAHKSPGISGTAGSI